MKEGSLAKNPSRPTHYHLEDSLGHHLPISWYGLQDSRKVLSLAVQPLLSCLYLVEHFQVHSIPSKTPCTATLHPHCTRNKKLLSDYLKATSYMQMPYVSTCRIMVENAYLLSLRALSISLSHAVAASRLAPTLCHRGINAS